MITNGSVVRAIAFAILFCEYELQCSLKFSCLPYS